jgi:DNA topoisomerase-1
MMIAQQLYEGVNLEEGREGLITYMRTDSTRVSPQAQQELRKFIPREYGESYLHPKPKVFKKKGKAQDAHEAIRPTQLLRFPSKVKGFLNRDQYRLYKLIWERFVATQMADATYLRRKVEIRAREYIFAAQSTSLLFDGFLAVLKLAPLKDEGVKIPSLREGFSLPRPKILTEQHFTEPPKRYSEASLVEALEEKGVGRPSTYAKIVSTIQERGYVVREKGILKPTLLGFIATDFLKEYFPLTTSEDFTAQMEENLDQIGDGKLSRLEVLSSFYEPFSKLLRLTEESLQKQGFHILTNIQCNRCGAPMEVRYWKGSSYLSCSSYPTCKNTFNLVEYKYNYSSKKAFLKIKKDSRTCPVCGAPMELKQSKYGRFYGCTNYPECKATEPIYLDVPCPLCGGRLKQRRSKKHNKTFYGCSNYPECKFAVWKKPIRICPHCEKGVLISKGEKIKCTNCGHIADEDLSV